VAKGGIVGMRKNQANLTAAEWTAFQNALAVGTNLANPAPRYRDFVRVHVAAMSPAGMPWAVHGMPQMGMDGRNFLAWHRHYLLVFERRLQAIDANVTVPYWDWIAQPQVPPQLSGSAFLNRWGSRGRGTLPNSRTNRMWMRQRGGPTSPPSSRGWRMSITRYTGQSAGR